MSNAIALVLGANGRFGAAAVAAFAAAGWTVLAQARRAPAGLPPGARHLAVALDDTEALVAAAAGASVVVHAVNPVYTDWARQLLPLARQGLDAAERLGALFMLPGNVYGYGENMPSVLREDTPERPTTEKGRLRVELEAEIAGRAHAGRLRAVVIRAGDFYGGGQGSWLDLAVVKSLRAGKLVYPGPLDVAHAWAYLPDLARAFVAVAEQADPDHAPAFETLHFSGHTLTGTELLDAVQDAATDLGAAPPVVATRGWRRGAMPWGFIRTMGLVVPMMKAVAEMSYLWRVPHALDGSRLAKRIGPQPQTPPRQALRQALEQLGFGTASEPPVSSPAPRPMRARALGALLIVEGLLALAPIAILGPAIGWPASLDKPAAEQLAAIAAAPGAVTAGYGVYLLYSILIAPVMIALAARLHGGLASPLGLTVAAFAALSALARSFGILRWLTVMPGLAAAHAAAEPAARGQIEFVFDALTTYGGGIGEVLGVSLFMALAVGLLALGALRRGGLPGWAAAFGLVVALSLGALALPVFGAPDPMPVAVAVSLLSLWMVSVGVRCVWGGPLK